MRTVNVIQKICLIGEPAVGKTSLVRRFVMDQFDDRYITTVGTKVTKKKIKFEIPENDTNVEMTLMIWDISGQKKTPQTMTMYLRGSKGALVVGDLSRPETLASIRDTVTSLRVEVGDVPVVVLANKCDLIGNPERAEALVNEHVGDLGIEHCVTSAKTGDNVEESFMLVGRGIVGKMDSEGVLNAA